MGGDVGGFVTAMALLSLDSPTFKSYSFLFLESPSSKREKIDFKVKQQAKYFNKIDLV